MAMAPSVVAFVSPSERSHSILAATRSDGNDHRDADATNILGGVHERRDVLRSGSSFAAALILGCGPGSALAVPEQKVYSSNARNMQRLGSGDSSGGSVYDNNPTSAKARARRAMVGCKNGGARSLAGEKIGKKQLSEKECNQLVMSGEPDFMLGALTELDCPTCPYGIGSR